MATPAENIRLEGPLTLLAGRGGKSKSDIPFTFKLFNNGILSFYKKDETTPSGSINLYDAKVDRRDQSDAAANVITLVTQTQTHFLKAQSPMEYRSWIGEITSVINQFNEMNKQETKMFYGVPSVMATQNEEFSDEPECDSDSDVEARDAPGEIVNQDQIKAALIDKLKQLNKAIDKDGGAAEEDLLESCNNPDYILLKDKERVDTTHETNVSRSLIDFSLPPDSQFLCSYKASCSRSKQGGTGQKVSGVVYIFGSFIVFKADSFNGEDDKGEDEASFRLMFTAVQAISIPSLPEITNCLTHVYLRPSKTGVFSIVSEDSVVDLTFREEASVFFNLFVDLLYITRTGLAILPEEERTAKLRFIPTVEASARQQQTRSTVTQTGSSQSEKDESLYPSIAVTLLLPSSYILVANTLRIGSKYQPQNTNPYIPLYTTVVPDFIVLRQDRFDIAPQFIRLADCISCLSDHQTKESFTGTIRFVNSKKLLFKTTSTGSTQTVVDRINRHRQDIKFDEFNYTLKALCNANSDEYVDATKYLFKIFDISHETLLNMFQCNITINKQKYPKVTLYITHKHLCITNGNVGSDPISIGSGDKKGEAIKKMFKFEHVKDLIPHNSLLGISSVDVSFSAGGGATVVTITKVFGNTFENCIKILVDLWAISKGEEPPSLGSGVAEPTTAALQDSDKEGYLEMFSTENKQWVKFWVVLYMNIIYIFATPHDTSPATTIVLNKSISIMNDNITKNMKATGGLYQNTFSILFTNEMCYIFRDNNYVNCRDWCDMINAISNNVRLAAKASMIDATGTEGENQTEGVGSITQALLETSMVNSMEALITACTRRVKLNLLDDDVIVCLRPLSLGSKTLAGKGKLAVTRRMVIFYYPGTYNIKYLALLAAIDEVTVTRKVLKITFKNTLFSGDDTGGGGRAVIFAPSEHAKGLCKIIKDMKALSLGRVPPSTPDRDMVRQKFRMLTENISNTLGSTEKGREKVHKETETETMERLGLMYHCSAPSLVAPKFCGFLQYLDLVNGEWKTVWCMIHGGGSASSGYATPHRFYVFEDKSSAEPLLSFTLCDCVAANADSLLRDKFLNNYNNAVTPSEISKQPRDGQGARSHTHNSKSQATFGVFMMNKETHLFYANSSKLAMSWQYRINILTPHMRSSAYKEIMNDIQTANLSNITLDTKLRNLFTIDSLRGEYPVYKTDCTLDGKQSTLVLTMSTLYVFHGHNLATATKHSCRIPWIDTVSAGDDGKSIRIRRFLDDMEGLRNAANLTLEPGKVSHKAKEASRGKIGKTFLKQLMSQGSSVSKHMAFLTLDGTTEDVELNAILSVLNGLAKPNKDATEDLLLTGLKPHDFIKAIKDIMFVSTTVTAAIDSRASLTLYRPLPPNLVLTKIPSLAERNGLNPTFVGLMLQNPRSWRCHLRSDERRNEWIRGTLVLHKGAVFFFRSKWDVEPYKGMQLRDAVVAAAEHLTGSENSFGIFNKSAKFMIVKYTQVRWLGEEIWGSSSGPAGAVSLGKDKEKEKDKTKEDTKEQTKQGAKTVIGQAIKETDIFQAIQREIDGLPEKISPEDAQAILQLIMSSNTQGRGLTGASGFGLNSALSDQRRFYERFRRMVPRGEKIIMPPVHCCLTRNIQIPGEVFVTANYLCFCSDACEPEVKEVVPLRFVDSTQTAMSRRALAEAGPDGDTKKMPKFLRSLIQPYTQLVDVASSMYTVFPGLIVRERSPADTQQAKADDERMRQRLKDPMFSRLDDATKKCQAEQIQSLFIVHGSRPYKNCTTGASYFSTQKTEGYADRVQADDEESSDVISDDDSESSRQDDASNAASGGAGSSSTQLTPYTVVLTNIAQAIPFTRKVDELVDVCCGRIAKSLLTRKLVPVGDSALTRPDLVCNVQFLSGSASQGWRRGIIVAKDGVLLLFKGAAADKELAHVQFSSLSLVQKYDLSCNLVSDAAIVTGISNTYAIVTCRLDKSRLIQLAESLRDEEHEATADDKPTNTNTNSNTKSQPNTAEAEATNVDIIPPIFVRLGDDTHEEDSVIVSSRFVDRSLARAAANANNRRMQKGEDNNNNRKKNEEESSDSDSDADAARNTKGDQRSVSKTLVLPVERIAKLLMTVFAFSGRLAPPAVISKLRQGAKIGQALDATEQWSQFGLPASEFPIVNAVCAMRNSHTTTVPIPGRLFVSRNYICFSGRLLNTEARIVSRISRVANIEADENAVGECTQIALTGGFLTDPLEADTDTVAVDYKGTRSWNSLGTNYDESEFNILQKVVDSTIKLRNAEEAAKKAAEIASKQEKDNDKEKEKENEEDSDTQKGPGPEGKQGENVYYHSGSFTVSRLSTATSSQILTVLKDAYEASLGNIPPTLLNVTAMPSANAFFPRYCEPSSAPPSAFTPTAPVKEGWLSRLSFTTQNVNGVTKGVHQWTRLYGVLWNSRLLLFAALHNSPVRSAIPLEPRLEVTGLAQGRLGFGGLGGGAPGENTKCGIEMGFLDAKNQFIQSGDKHDLLTTIRREMGEPACNDNHALDEELQRRGLRRAVVLTFFKAQDLTTDSRASNDTGGVDTVDVVLSAPSGEIEEWFEALRGERERARVRYHPEPPRESSTPARSITISIGGIQTLNVAFDLTAPSQPSYAKAKGPISLTLAKVLTGPDAGKLLLHVVKRKASVRTLSVLSLVDVEFKAGLLSSLCLTYMSGASAQRVTFVSDNSHDCEIWAKGLMELMWY